MPVGIHKGLCAGVGFVGDHQAVGCHVVRGRLCFNNLNTGIVGATIAGGFCHLLYTGSF